MPSRAVAVQVHLPEANGVRRGVTRLDGRHAADVAHVRHRRQPANGGFYRAAKVGESMVWAIFSDPRLQEMSLPISA